MKKTQRKTLKIAAFALVIGLITGTIATATTFYFIFNETPFEPTNYSWQEPWEVKEMVDFLEATLTIQGCAYQGQLHDITLEIKNVATVADYYAFSFAYTANWFVDPDNEVIIQGNYEGTLGIGESIIDTTNWQPSLIGVGVVKLDIIDIIWHKTEPITWTTSTDITGFEGKVSITDMAVTGAQMTYVDGTFEFTLKNTRGSGITLEVSYTITIPELGQTIYEGVSDPIPDQASKIITHEFSGVTTGGDLTMLVTVTGINTI